MFDDRVYKRGALLLHALRLTLGEGEFFAILKGWATDYAHSTVSTEMFVQFVESQSDTPVSELFDRWLSEEALPELPVAP
jgi:aminopeptidase N